MTRLWRIGQLLVLLAGFGMHAASAQEAWLVTYGPGGEVWERFGHNALWLRDAERDLDHTFSFGYFEIDRPGFHLDFARGIMRYYGSAATPEREFAFYRMRDRSITAQRLNLDRAQVHELHQLLYEAIFPIPQYYDYNYFYNNCSTWLRDLIDQVVDGRLRAGLEGKPARLNFRDHIRRFTEDRVELHAGLNLLLGPEIDRSRSAWEEAFVPEALARALGAMEIDGEPLVVETRILYESVNHEVAEHPGSLWWFYALVGIACALGIALAGRRQPSFWNRLPWRAAVIGYFLAASLILLMWFATSHQVVAGNLVLLLVNPLWVALLVPSPPFFRVALWWLLAASAAAGAVLLAVPDGPQYRGELLFWLVPMTAAMLWHARAGNIREEA